MAISAPVVCAALDRDIAGLDASFVAEREPTLSNACRGGHTPSWCQADRLRRVGIAPFVRNQDAIVQGWVLFREILRPMRWQEKPYGTAKYFAYACQALIPMASIQFQNLR